MKPHYLSLCLFAGSMLLTACGGDSGSGSSSSSSSSQYKAVAPLRYLSENYQQLSNSKIASYLAALSDTDKETLGYYYTAFARYLQYLGCQADSSLVVKQLPTALSVNTTPLDCVTNQAYIDNTIQLLQSTGPYSPGDEFRYAHDKALELLTVIKCDTGEIDQGTCSLYNQILNSQTKNSENFYKDLADANSEATRLLADQCSYDGQRLPNGALCVI